MSIFRVPICVSFLYDCKDDAGEFFTGAGTMNYIISIVCLYLLRLAGQKINKKKIFQKIFLPPSITSGLLGLLIIQVTGRFLPSALTRGWEEFPVHLINIVFAGLFMSFSLPSLAPRNIWKYCGPQLVYGQIVAWGQYCIAIFVSWVVLAPSFNTPPHLGIIIPLGFEGGHGTTAALKSTFETLNWAKGADYSFAAATFGILSALVTGMFLINWAVRQGYTAVIKRTEDVVAVKNQLSQDAGGDACSGGAPVGCNAFGAYLLHLLLIALAILIGFAVKHGFMLLESFIFVLSEKQLFRIIPLAPFSIFGAILLCYLLKFYLPKIPVEPRKMQRVSCLALDYLIISAIVTLNVKNIAEGFIPFLCLVLVTVFWNVFCVLWLARRILPDAWFERAIVQLGQSMGVTSTGLLLLRVVDPKMETKAISAFGYKQLIHEPLMGGGLWPFVAIPLVIIHGPTIVFIISLMAIVIWLCVWWISFPKEAVRETQLP